MHNPIKVIANHMTSLSIQSPYSSKYYPKDEFKRRRLDHHEVLERIKGIDVT
jgi:hypothetical protein